MRKHLRVPGFVLLMFFGLVCYSAHAAETGSIPVGTVLSEFKLEGPTAEPDREYLGLKGSDPFTLSQVSGKLVIIDFFNTL